MRTFAAFRRAWSPPDDGSAAAHPALEEFARSKLTRYADDRDFPGRDATSKLSPLVASGELTIADCAAAALAAPPSRGREKWLDELCWHGWFEHVKSSGLDAPRLEPEVASRPAAPLRRWIPEPGTHISLGLQPVERRVQRPDRDLALRPPRDLAPDRYSVGALAEPHDGQENQLFEFTQVRVPHISSEL